MPSKATIWWFKLTHWEFWSFSAVYFPVNFYFLWLSVKCRSFFFFTAANPAIDFGGMLGESKSAIYDLIPKNYLPNYKTFTAGDINAMEFADEIGFPLIAKPDIGERGRLVEKINDAEALKNYLDKCPVTFILQELIDLPIELGVFYVKIPGEKGGRITSIVVKDFLRVTGDGISTTETLLLQNPRACAQIDFSHPRFLELLQEIPHDNECILVEGIGNHCRGTTFLDGKKHITLGLEAAFDNLCDEIPGFYFGRFDLRCNSFEELEQLENFKILELNGAGAEPAHIYQPGSSIWKAYNSIFWHLSTLAQISQSNKQLGVPYWGFQKGMNKLKMIRQYNKKTQSLR